MEVFRLVRKPFSGSLSGKGAALKGARWNSVGVELIYTAANRSLCMAEVTVHFSLATIPDDYMMMTLYVPDNISLKKLHVESLSSDWNVFPHPASTQAIGDSFVSEKQHCILQVPSVVTKGDYNFLLNPAHPDFKRIKIIETDPFPFDKRIFR